MKTNRFKPVDILKNCYQFEKNCDKSIINKDFVKEGLIYIQSVSSMIPPVILSPLLDENILDIAASPGSKTSQMAALSANKAFIDAVEPDFIRMERLKKNMSVLGCNNINFFKSYGEKFNPQKKYDRILADLPCSGEGRFNIYDRSSYINWSLSQINKLSNLQKKILRNCFGLLKTGGLMVYSTCTLNPIENELVVDNLISENAGKIEIVPPPASFFRLNEFVEPLKSYQGIMINPQVYKKTLKFVPSERMEGFFIACFRKISD